ncbi:prephenate dehydrogenase [Clostridium fermenticellae]|uniref:Prephenate dehydrogenase n=1 Tax=Clostridium fermenticellae TaxID=2068654 RepID=A0A386H4J5_9CLOT|nr:prephenate dehydrogenase [Clostridium fermenticellae]AYD40453.1 prephenate dehydrogenase [Clostridium fermenticellae]
MEDHDFRLNIVVVGLGLIGSSFAMALKKLKPKNIWGIDKDKDTVDIALSKNIIDKGFTSERYILKTADITVIALYPENTVEFVKENIKNFKKNSIIIDVSGIKSKVVEDINSFLPEDLEFIGTHPMAGRENRGVKYARDDIFNGTNYVITPSCRNKEKNLDLIESIAKKIGFKNVVYTSPKEHDDMIAFTSQMPHVLAAALIDSITDESDVNLFIGGSFKDVTRVALINPELWAELFTVNSDALIGKIEKFEESLDRIRTAVKLKDRQTLCAIFKDVTYKRKQIF